MQSYYRSWLADVNGVPTYLEGKQAFLTIGQPRYMDGTITTPLLLVKMFMMLCVNGRRFNRLLTIALLGDVGTILTRCRLPTRSPTRSIRRE